MRHGLAQSPTLFGSEMSPRRTPPTPPTPPSLSPPYVDDTEGSDAGAHDGTTASLLDSSLVVIDDVDELSPSTGAFGASLDSESMRVDVRNKDHASLPQTPLVDHDTPTTRGKRRRVEVSANSPRHSAMATALPGACRSVL